MNTVVTTCSTCLSSENKQDFHYNRSQSFFNPSSLGKKKEMVGTTLVCTRLAKCKLQGRKLQRDETKGQSPQSQNSSGEMKQSVQVKRNTVHKERNGKDKKNIQRTSTSRLPHFPSVFLSFHALFRRPSSLAGRESPGSSVRLLCVPA